MLQIDSRKYIAVLLLQSGLGVPAHMISIARVVLDAGCLTVVCYIGSKSFTCSES